MKPLVSICIPVFNGALYIKKCLDSILCQSISDIEIIIADNCSTDSTVEVVRSFIDHRIRLFEHKQNLGCLKNFDFVIKCAVAPYIKTFCADDVMLPGLLSAQVKALIDIPQIGLVGCDFIVTDSELNPISVARCEPGFNMPSEIALKSVNSKNNLFGGPSNFMWRRSQGEGVLYDGDLRYLPDFYFAATLCPNLMFYNASTAGYLYRRHNSTVTVTECTPPLQWNEWGQMFLRWKGNELETLKSLIAHASNNELRHKLLQKLNEIKPPEKRSIGIKDIIKRFIESEGFR